MSLGGLKVNQIVCTLGEAGYFCEQNSYNVALLFFQHLQTNFYYILDFSKHSGTYQYQFGCGILKMVGPKKQEFWPKINLLKGNDCILRIRGAPVRQKLGMILENKVVQKLKLEKKCFFYKKWSPKLIVLNEFFF